MTANYYELLPFTTVCSGIVVALTRRHGTGTAPAADPRPQTTFWAWRSPSLW